MTGGGGPGNMPRYFGFKIKITISVLLAATAFVSVFLISSFKYNPYLTFAYFNMQARYLVYKTEFLIYSQGHGTIHDPSLAAEKGIPILFYSGITSSPTKSSVSFKDFKDQMFALRSAGYNTISLSEYNSFMKGERELPARSILVTFDDGRKDSYYNADPVLHAVGFRASMFVITGQSMVDRHNFHLTKHEILQMDASGRWDIGSHGQSNHSFYIINESGRKNNENQVESENDFRKRVKSDLLASKSSLDGLLGKETIAFSVPLSDRSSSFEISKLSESIVNDEATKIFRISFNDYWPRQSDNFRFAPISHDNAAHRYLVLADVKGDDLVADLQKGDTPALPYKNNFLNSGNWVPLSGRVEPKKDDISFVSGKNGSAAYLDGSYGWRDYAFSAKLIEVSTNTIVSLLARYQDGGNYLSCEFRPNKLELRSYSKGIPRVISGLRITDDYRLSPGASLGMKVIDDVAQCFYNGRPLLVSDGVDPGNGGVAVKTWNANNKPQELVLADIEVSDQSTKNISKNSSKSDIGSIYGFLNEGDLRTADLMLDDVYAIDRYESVKINPIKWTENFYNEQYWRFQFYSLQPTRHLLAMWLKTGNVIYRDKMVKIIESFIDNGMDKKFSWDKHGSAYRTMVLVNTYNKLKENDSLTSGLDTKIRIALARHGQFLASPSNYESSYNHGLDQAMALLVLSENFKDIDQNGQWKKLAIKRLQDGLNTIIDEDGILVENSPYYHFYCLTKYWALGQYLTRNNIVLENGFNGLLNSKIKAMTDYGSRILEPDLSIPRLGASIEGKINYAGEYKELGGFDKHFLNVLTQGMQGEPPVSNSIYYPNAGQTIMRSGWPGKDRYAKVAQVIFDVGKYRTNHSDLDALSFNLYANGGELLPDSGFYTYEVNKYLKYFHGTRSHNTVVVDGKDQTSGLDDTPGLLDDPFVKAGPLITGEGFSGQTASHNLYKGVVHNRSLTLIEDKALVIVDDLSSDTEHTYEQMFHIFPGAKVSINKTTVRAIGTSTERSLTISQLLPDGIKVGNTINKKDPVEGLCATTYENADPCNSISFGQKGKNISFVTIVQIGDQNQIKASLQGNNVIVKTKKGNYTITLQRQAGRPRIIKVDKKYDAEKTINSNKFLSDYADPKNWEIKNNGSNEGNLESFAESSNNKYIKITPPTDGSSYDIIKKVGFDLTKNNIYFKMKVNGWNSFKNISVYLSNDNWKNFAEYTLNSDIYPSEYDGQWVNLSIARGEKRKIKLGNWIYSADPFDWSRIDAIKFHTLKYENQKGSLDIGNFMTLPEQKGGRVVIIFDDGWSSTLRAAEIMRKYGIEGVVSVISGDVYKKAYMTVDQLKKLQNYYHWDLVNHSFYHKNSVLYYYNSNKLADLEKDILDGFQFLSKYGINSNPNWFIYPDGMNNESVKKIVKKYYTFARGTQDVPESMPFADPYSVKVFSSYSDRSNNKDIENAVSDAKKFNLTLFLMFHKLTDKTSGMEFTEYNAKDFEEVIGKIKQSGIKVVTLSELDKENNVPRNSYTITNAVPPQLTMSIHSKNISQ
jgi:peptidoglycan/xylan/chitin deacetylase (PgdA/CDA1 family)